MISFIQDQQYMQGLYDILIFHFLWVVLQNNISEHSGSLYFCYSKTPKQCTTLLNPATKKLFNRKVFVETMKQFVQKWQQLEWKQD